MRVATIIAHKDYNIYLGQCLESCKNQTHPNTIFLVDDCSKNLEDVKLIYKEHAPVGSSIIINDKNKGPSFCRNAALNQCFDEFDAFMILDADDYMMPNKVEKMVSILEKYEDVGVVYADYFLENCLKDTKKIEFKKPYDIKLLRERCIVHSGSLIRKEALQFAFEKDGYFYDETLRTCEDYDLWLRISSKFIFYHIAEPLTYVRDHKDNSTYSVNQKIWSENLNRVYQKNLK